MIALLTVQRRVRDAVLARDWPRVAPDAVESTLVGTYLDGWVKLEGALRRNGRYTEAEEATRSAAAMEAALVSRPRSP